MPELNKLLINAYRGDNESLLQIIQKFQPLLNKYAYKLRYEDSYADLQMKLIEMIKSHDPTQMQTNNEGCLVNYIRQSIYHSYLYISKAKERTKVSLVSFPNNEDSSDQYCCEWDKLYFKYDTNDWIEFDFLKNILSIREADIIMYYWECATVKEIAKKYNVTSAAITQSKKNAIKKLKSSYCIND